jgi:predicted RNA binding protein YcfA (HicA-like mRNA interferase family)
MPAFGPVSRAELLRALRSLGFEGPYSGGKHQFMVRAQLTLRIPNPHQGDIGRDLLARILRQAGIDRETWDKA